MSGLKIYEVEQMPVFQLFYKLTLDIEKLTRDFDKDFIWLRI